MLPMLITMLITDEKYQANIYNYDRGVYLAVQPTQEELDITKAYYSDLSLNSRLIGEKFGRSGQGVRDIVNRTTQRLIYQGKSWN